MFRVLTAKFQQQLGFGVHGLATRAAPRLSSRVTLIPQPRDIMEVQPHLPPPLLPTPQPKPALPKPAQATLVKAPISHEDRVHSLGGVPINILSH